MRTTIILYTLLLTFSAALSQDAAVAPFVALSQTRDSVTNTIKNYVTAPVNGPTNIISGDDVVQGSVQMFRYGTNGFFVRWTYTEAGARKALANWEAHPPPHATYSAKWKEGWLKHRTDKGFFKTEEAANAFMTNLTSK